LPNKDTYPSYFDFEKKVKTGKLEPVYFVLADDSYFLNKASELLREKLTGSKLNNENYFLRYADETSLDELLDLSNNFSSLFVQKKLIVLRKCEKFGRKIDELIEYTKKTDSDTTMIIAFDKEYVSDKKLDRILNFYDFSALSDKEYYDWLRNEFTILGCEIDEDTLYMFSDYVPRYFDLAVNEIKKVSDYLLDSKDKKVTKEVILKLSGYESEYTPLELMAFVVKKDCTNALKVLDYLLNKESLNEVFLLTVITNLYMDLMAVRNERILNMQNKEFYLNFKIWGEKINFVKTHHDYAKNLDFKYIFGKLLETDQKLKTSMLDPKVLFFSLIEEITSN
jgi:DNA polymerase III subunit delta